MTHFGTVHDPKHRLTTAFAELTRAICMCRDSRLISPISSQRNNARCLSSRMIWLVIGGADE